jgi:hypothetical protein
VLISNIPDCERWSATSNWNTVLLKKYGNRMFKCGEDDDGYKVKIKLKYFLKYMKKNTGIHYGLPFLVSVLLINKFPFLALFLYY